MRYLSVFLLVVLIVQLASSAMLSTSSLGSKKQTELKTQDVTLHEKIIRPSGPEKLISARVASQEVVQNMRGISVGTRLLIRTYKSVEWLKFKRIRSTGAMRLRIKQVNGKKVRVDRVANVFIKRFGESKYSRIWKEGRKTPQGKRTGFIQPAPEQATDITFSPGCPVFFFLSGWGENSC